MKKQLSFIAALLVSISTFCYGQNKVENLGINWPDEYNWQVGSNQENDKMHMIELVPGNETVEKWTIIGTMISIKGVKGVPMDKMMQITYDQSKEKAPKAKLTLVEKGDKWILFKIESPSFKGDKTPESQLFYIIQGEQSLYTNMVAIKEKALDAAFVEKWSAVFKSSQLLTE